MGFAPEGVVQRLRLWVDTYRTGVRFPPIYHPNLRRGGGALAMAGGIGVGQVGSTCLWADFACRVLPSGVKKKKTLYGFCTALDSVSSIDCPSTSVSTSWYPESSTLSSRFTDHHLSTILCIIGIYLIVLTPPRLFDPILL